MTNKDRSFSIVVVAVAILCMASSAICQEDEFSLTLNHCACPLIYQPVCGIDGKTYDNRCKADCAKVSVAYLGACSSDNCVCTLEYRPVCGKDGKTYGNACAARCAKVDIAYNGECKAQGCICNTMYQPVCGDDGKTYSNACLAKCAGITKYTNGWCPVTADPCKRLQCRRGYHCEARRYNCIRSPCPVVGVCVSNRYCDYSNAKRPYTFKNVDTCRRTWITCPPGTSYFRDTCGCGCAN